MSSGAQPTSAPLRALLRASLAHEYYGGAFDQFTTTPLPTTAALCRQLGIQVLQSGPSLTVFVRCLPTRWATSAPYRAAVANATLCWEIVPQPPEFAAVTDVAFAGGEQRIVLTDLTDSASGGRLTVHALASADDVWAWQPLAFDYVPSSPLPLGTSLEIATANGTIVARLTVADTALVPIDLTANGSGLYQLLRGKRVLARWFADERGPVAVGSAPASMLVVDGQWLTAAFTQTMAGSTPTRPPVYSAAYPAREVTWRYHIFNAEPASALEIATADDHADTATAPSSSAATAPRPFRPPAKGSRRKAKAPAQPFFPISAPEYPTAASFEATAPFKLVQQPPQRFALLCNGQTLFSPLPVAAPGFASRGQSADFCSDIFVYL